MSIWRYANPAEFMRITRPVLVPLWVLGVLVTGAALVMGFRAPIADLFGYSVKILYIHVPSALIAVNTYFLMVVASIIGLIRGHHVSYLVAKAAAPIGAAFTMIAIITGAVWGEPTWGAWWVWDARLTGILITFFFYLGYMAVWAAIDEPERAAELSAVLCLVGVVFALVSRYAFLFWETQHQGASLSVEEGQRVYDVYRTPLYISMVGFYLIFFALLLTRARTEIRLRRAQALELARGVA